MHPRAPPRLKFAAVTIAPLVRKILLGAAWRLADPAWRAWAGARVEGWERTDDGGVRLSDHGGVLATIDCREQD